MARKLKSTKRINQLRQDILKEQNTDRQFLHAVGQGKKSTDEGYQFYIYKMNSCKMLSDWPSFVFKASCIMA